MFKPKGPTQFWEEIGKFKKDHKANILAVKAVYQGHANEMQQKRALTFIIKFLCRADMINYYPDPYDSAFAQGREAVGKILRGIALDSDYINGDEL